MKRARLPLSVFGTAILALTLASCKAATPEVTRTSPAEIASEIRASKSLTMVHIWATWCAPCRDEFPELIQVMKAYPELDVLLVSGDDPNDLQAVTRFLIENDSPVGSRVSTQLNQDFIETFSPDWSGSLPATFFYFNGKLVQEWEGKRSFEIYQTTIETLINKERRSHD
ncbi:TlpA family protein disulfide reductase [Pontiella agarivorans]|uniref:TlpA disulfide reductase family protein n=1 Tax=Pontiella agarivorans TaxID=3038953 RepID=A0ABU5MZ11_9BACT|nr:TlpA disulfide reductase family protein [Pontiella agarivorans]MDZ8119435.1 TlpA disulfide reductase family protein [Pontiella agarivorans]